MFPRNSPGLVVVGWFGDSNGHGAVSVGSPSQEEAEGALAQWRDLNFLQLDEDGSHSDHSLHSAQPTATANKDHPIFRALHTDKIN